MLLLVVLHEKLCAYNLKVNFLVYWLMRNRQFYSSLKFLYFFYTIFAVIWYFNNMKLYCTWKRKQIVSSDQNCRKLITTGSWIPWLLTLRTRGCALHSWLWSAVHSTRTCNFVSADFWQYISLREHFEHQRVLNSSFGIHSALVKYILKLRFNILLKCKCSWGKMVASHCLKIRNYPKSLFEFYNISIM